MPRQHTRLTAHACGRLTGEALPKGADLSDTETRCTARSLFSRCFFFFAVDFFSPCAILKVSCLAFARGERETPT